MAKRSGAAEPDEPGGPAKPQYPIESVDNALKILLLLRERKQLRLTEVSEYLSVASSTAHRLLAMLQYRGFLRQDTTARTYEPGPALTELGFRVLRQLDVRERMRPTLEHLAAEYRETVHLSRLTGSLVSFVDVVESTRAVRLASRFGMTLPAHCSASGKAMLSTLSDDRVAELFPDEELERVTPNSLRTRAELRAELDRIRERGYATGRQESEDGVISVAVPLGSFMDAPYALSIGAPSHRYEDLPGTVADALQEAADRAGTLFS